MCAEVPMPSYEEVTQRARSLRVRAREHHTPYLRIAPIAAHAWCEWRNMCGVAADRWSCPAPWMSMILDKGDIRSHVSDREPASSLDVLGWCGASMSPFYTEGDLAGTPVSFSPSVRRI
jgi:hypothetical protein